MQYFARTSDIKVLLIAPLQVMLKDVQNLLDVELDSARIEEAPIDLQAHCLASSIFGQSPRQNEAQTPVFAALSRVEHVLADSLPQRGVRAVFAAPDADDEPIQTASRVSLSSPPPELFLNSPTAPIDPLLSFASAEASAPASTRSENRSGSPPYFAVSVPAGSEIADSGTGPILALSEVQFFGKTPEAKQIAPAASIEPAFSSASTGASAHVSIRSENQSVSPPYLAVSVPVGAETAIFRIEPISALSGVQQSGKTPEAKRITPAASIELAFSSAFTGASVPASIKSENRFPGPPSQFDVTVHAESATVDFSNAAATPVASGIPLYRRRPCAQLPDHPETATFRVAPPESSDSMLSSPPIKSTIPAGNMSGVPVVEADMSVVRIAAVPPVEGVEPYPGRANSIPLRPRKDSGAETSFAIPDQTSPPLRRRELEAAAARLAPAVEPSFDHAYRLTQTSLEERTTPSGQEAQSLVRNTFNVSVALNGISASEAIDRTALEEALTDILRTAARRHGLEI